MKINTNMTPEAQSSEQGRSSVYRNKHAYQWHDEAMTNLKAWHEEVDELKQQLAALQQQLAKYEARLEIDHVFDMDGKRVEIPPAERHKQIDGIYCRDATIKLQEEDVDCLQQQLAAVTKRTDSLVTQQTDTLNDCAVKLTAARQALADEQALRMKVEAILVTLAAIVSSITKIK